jgi:diguanylate cyclase (GGDEF)-like protein
MSDNKIDLHRRRDEKALESTNFQRMAGRLREFVQFKYHDLGTAADHAQDFRNIRAQYLRVRLMVLALALTILMPLWGCVDFYQLSGVQLQSIVAGRIALAIVLAVLTLAAWKVRRLTVIRLLLMAVVFAMSSFYFWAQLVLHEAINAHAIFGYSLFPFMLIAMLMVFPLTAKEGLIQSALVILALVGKHLVYDSITTVRAIQDFWLISVLIIVMFWSQLSQVSMLLRLYRQASRDPLTNLYNRIVIFRQLRILAKSAERRNKPFCVMMFDLDRFKRVNDKYGHSVGDQVLKEFARILRDSSRITDVAGRFGGEEFLLVLPSTTIDEAMVTAERIRVACEQQPLAIDGEQTISFTTSIGVAAWSPGEPISSLIDRVDEGLYQAKKTGRNRVTRCTEPGIA